MEITDGYTESRRRTNIKKIIMAASVAVIVLLVGFVFAKYNLFGNTSAEAYNAEPVPTDAVESHEAKKDAIRVAVEARAQNAVADDVVLEEDSVADPGELPHQHTYKSGVCSDCGYECQHELHSQDLICSECGSLVYHTYSSSHSCDICGRKIYESYDSLPDEFFQEIQEKGAVNSFVVDNHNVYVYQPYAYDRTSPYDVLLLIHGSGGQGIMVMNANARFGENTIYLTDFLDHMIEQHLCKPMLVVTFDFGGNYNPSGMYTYLQDSLLPFIVENFSTYASGTDAESLIAARDHFAIGGYSLGSMYTMNCGMQLALSYFSQFLCFAGTNGEEELIYALKHTDTDQYPIRYFFMNSGDTDGETVKCKKAFAQLLSRVGCFQNNQNAHLCITSGGHEWRPWFVGMYNSFQLLFQREVEVHEY